MEEANKGRLGGELSKCVSLLTASESYSSFELFHSVGNSVENNFWRRIGLGAGCLLIDLLRPGRGGCLSDPPGSAQRPAAFVSNLW